jgi:hypothetical protein
MSLRHLRAVCVISLLWAIAWLPLGLALALYYSWRYSVGTHGPNDVPPPTIAVSLIFWGLAGAIGGALFATILAITERRKSLKDLSFPRVVAWGALGSIIVPAGSLAADAMRHMYHGGWLETASILGLIGAFGSVTSGLTLRIARPNPRDQLEAPPPAA